MIQRQDDTLYMFMTSVSIGMDHDYRYSSQFMLGLRKPNTQHRQRPIKARVRLAGK